MNLTACVECDAATFDAINGLCAECNASHLLPASDSGEDYGSVSPTEPADCGEHKRVILVGRITGRRLVNQRGEWSHGLPYCECEDYRHEHELAGGCCSRLVGKARSLYVGPVCDDCAQYHLREYLTHDEDGNETGRS